MEEDEPRLMGDEALESEILDLVEKHPEGIWLEKIARVLEKSRMTVSKRVGELEAARKVRVRKEGTMKRVYPRSSAPKAEKAQVKF